MPARTGRPWQRVKARVIRRDGGICHLCGQPGADSADHLIPVAHGGQLYALDNLAAVHHNVEPKCNRVRGASTTTTARKRINAHLTRTGHTTDHQGWDW